MRRRLGELSAKWVARHFNNTGQDTCAPLRLAACGGISWNTVTKRTHGNWIYKVQSVRSLARRKAPHRLIRTKKGEVVGVVLHEASNLKEVNDFLEQISEGHQNGWEEIVSLDDIGAGDVIHVPSAVGRHYAIYDGKNFIEYQKDPEKIHKGKVQSVSKKEFRARISSNFGMAGLSDIRRVRYIGESSVEDSIKRAGAKVGMAGFNLLFRNCETFATYAKTGKGLSRQAISNIATILDKVMKLGIGAAALVGSFCLLKYGGIVIALRVFLIGNFGIFLPPAMFLPSALVATGLGGAAGALSVAVQAVGKRAHQPLEEKDLL